MVISPVVVYHAEFVFAYLTTPLYRLGDGAAGCYGAVGGVGVGGGDVAGGTEYFAHVLGEVESVGVPRAVFLDSKRAGGDGLRRIPGDEPKPRVVAAGEVDAGDLQVTTVQVTLVQRDGAVDGYLLKAAAAHAVVRAGHHGAGGFIGEADGAVLCIVDGGPDAGLGLDERLVTVGVEDGREAEVCFVL